MCVDVVQTQLWPSHPVSICSQRRWVPPPPGVVHMNPESVFNLPNCLIIVNDPDHCVKTDRGVEGSPQVTRPLWQLAEDGSDLGRKWGDLRVFM